MGRRKKKPEPWPPAWAGLPSAEELERLSRGEEVAARRTQQRLLFSRTGSMFEALRKAKEPAK